MRVNYGQSDVLKCSVQLVNDRYHTSFTAADYHNIPVNTPPQTSKDIVNRNPEAFGGTYGPGSDFVERDPATGVPMNGTSMPNPITERQALGLDPL